MRYTEIITEDTALIKAEHLVRQAIQNSQPKLVVTSGVNAVALTKSLDPEFRFRLTVFHTGQPTGHVEYSNDEAAIQEMTADLADVIRQQSEQSVD
jgi:hypothetical protein